MLTAKDMMICLARSEGAIGALVRMIPHKGRSRGAQG